MGSFGAGQKLRPDGDECVLRLRRRRVVVDTVPRPFCRPSLRETYRSGGDGIHVGAIDAAIAVDVPAWIEGLSRFDPAGQSKRVENIHPAIVIDVFWSER